MVKYKSWKAGVLLKETILYGTAKRYLIDRGTGTYNEVRIKQLKVNMKIFLSYGHDSNAPLIEKIKDYLSKDAEGDLKNEVWIDTSEIKARKDWREKISKGVLYEQHFEQIGLIL